MFDRPKRGGKVQELPHRGVRHSSIIGPRDSANVDRMEPSSSALEKARLHIERLSRVSRLLTRATDLERAFADVCKVATETLALSTAVLLEHTLESTEDEPRTTVWGRQGARDGQLSAAVKRAEAWYQAVAIGEETHSQASFRYDLDETPTFVCVPLAVDERAPFGFVQFELLPFTAMARSGLDESDRSFVNFIAVQLALALDQRATRRQEARLRERRELVEQQQLQVLAREAEVVTAQAAEAINEREQRDSFVEEARQVAERTAVRASRLLGITTLLTQALTARDVAEVIVNRGISVLGARAGCIALWTRAEPACEILASVGYVAPEMQAKKRLPVHGPLPLSEALRTERPVWIGAFEENGAAAGGDEDDDIGSYAAIPLELEPSGTSGAQAPDALGVLGLSFPEPRAFDDEERAFLVALAQQCAHALVRGRRYEAERRARTEAEAAERRSVFLAQATTTLASSLDYRTTLASVAELAVPHVADWCVVDLVEQDGQVRRVAAAHANPSNNALVQKLCDVLPGLGSDGPLSGGLRSGQPAIFTQITGTILSAMAQGDHNVPIVRALGCECLMTMPLIARGRILGLILFVSATSERRYGEADLTLARELAPRAALALDNARLYADAQATIRAREETLAVVSHDLRGPLSAIAVASGIIRRRLEEAPHPSLKQAVDTIDRQLGHMTGLIGDLLDLAKLEAGRFSTSRLACDALELLRDAVRLVEPLADARLALTFEAKAELPPILADRHQLVRVLTNLLGNAIKFTPVGGTVHATAALDASSVRFAVEDTGAGIAPDELGHVFDRYWQANEGAKRGVGLGLAIAKAIVESHGGRIYATSTRGTGSVFTFTIPRAEM